MEKTIDYVKAGKIFNKRHKIMNFDVPVFKERTELVPEIDENYEFNIETLVPVLWGIINNKKTWISGHTGTGKSTLVAQICARLNYPLIRINFDSEISRMDMVGRDILTKDESGATISRFVDGILPQALQQPCIMLCDEIDFIRPDIAYVFQRALEDEGLLISEDGGRLVKPHKMFRIIATANTQGQGDDFGIYQGARSQSMAFLDRFTVWVNCDYLDEEQEEKLLSKLVPNLRNDLLIQIMNYAKEHREAFSQLKISQPLSPRTLETFAQACLFYDVIDDNPLMKAAKNTLLCKSNDSDNNIIIGILDRVAIAKKNKETSDKDKIETLDDVLKDIESKVA